MDGMDIFGSLLAYQGTQDTNAANREIAQQNNAWSAEQFASRYQTSVKDMQAAGLNPMLAYSQGGGSPPTAQQVQFQNPMASAQQAFHQGAERDVMKQNIEKSKQDVTQSEEQIRNLKAQNLLIEQQANLASSQARVADAQATKALMETPRVSVEKAKLLADTNTALEQPKFIKQQTITSATQARRNKAESRITEADLARAKNEEAAQGSWFKRKISPYLPGGLRGLGFGVNK